MTTTLPFENTPFKSRFIDRLPGDPETRNFTRHVMNALYSETAPTAVANPSLLAWSGDLASELGLPREPSGEAARASIAAVFAGNALAPGMRPYASRYGGHQFGNWADQLGDGRAITLGELELDAPSNAATYPARSFEFQLKGAGPTPYSRRADGRAVLRSSIREFVCSEAMHALGVPTTRAISLVLTGEEVVRDLFYDGNPRPEPGAIVCRVSPSFVRFGNFELASSRGEHELLARLADVVIEDHFPSLAPLTGPEKYAAFLDEVALRTATLMADWMRVGFVHGVMNTDNLSILGLTIDYGPYGWLETYEPDWTPNTTDREHRRYRYSQQPAIGHWNLARLAEALFPLIPEEKRLIASLTLYAETFERADRENFARKLGLPATHAALPAIRKSLERLLESTECDFTNFFRALTELATEGDASEEAFFTRLEETRTGTTPLRESERRHWVEWYASLRSAGGAERGRAETMRAANPIFVPRNYLLQIAIRAAEAGDLAPLERLRNVLRTPYSPSPGNEDLAAKRPEWAKTSPGSSALSCSS